MEGLTERRKAAGITQEQVAAALNVTQGAVSQWERGEVLPTIPNLVKLARLLGCTVDDLMRDVIVEV